MHPSSYESRTQIERTLKDSGRVPETPEPEAPPAHRMRLLPSIPVVGIVIEVNAQVDEKVIVWIQACLESS